MHPRLTETEANELKLDSYVMHIHNTHCSRCDSGERYCTMYEVWIHPSKTRTTGFRQLRRTADGGKTVLADLHIEYIEMPEHAIPICSDCIQTYKSATDKTPEQAISASAWAETLKRKYAPAPREIKIAKSTGADFIPAPRAEDL